MTIPLFVSAIVGFVIAIVAIVQLSGMRKARHSELIIDLTQMWESEALTKSRQLVNQLAANRKLKDIIHQSYEDNSDQYFTLMRIPNFFDALGGMIMHGDLPQKLAKELFGPPVKHYWALYEKALTVADLEGVSRFQELGKEKSSIW